MVRSDNIVRPFRNNCLRLALPQFFRPAPHAQIDRAVLDVDEPSSRAQSERGQDNSMRPKHSGFESGPLAMADRPSR
jgi:hypothetical protein